MFTDISQKLIDFFQNDENLDGIIKTVSYGSPEMIPTTAQPALLLNCLGMEKTPIGGTEINLKLDFRLYGLTSEMSDNYTATTKAQDLLWLYDDGQQEDLGIMPCLLSKRNSVMLTDKFQRPWVLVDISAPRFYSENSGKNYLGAVEIDFTLQTLLS